MLLGHTEPQLDFIIESYVEENPKGGISVSRPGKVNSTQMATMADVGWANVLVGSAYQQFMGKHMPPEAVLRRLRGEPAIEQVPVLNTARPQSVILPDR